MTTTFILGALEAEKFQKNKVAKVLVETLYFWIVLEIVQIVS